MGSAPYVPIEIVDLDSDNDGVIGGPDVLAYAAAHNSVKGDPNYDRQFDANFDDSVDSDDQAIFIDTYYGINNLGTIRNTIKTDTIQKLTWSDNWSAWLVAVEENYTVGFTGRDNYSPPGWISIHRHPYISVDYKYVCGYFAIDTAVGAYKGLGYGCLLVARSGPHAYNFIWLGGDWTNLNNWRVVEPHSGKVYSATGYSEGTTYDTYRIYFFDYADGLRLYHHYLTVDVQAETVSYGGSGSINWYPSQSPEEPYPATFDRTLGIPSVTPTVSTQPASNIEQTSAIGNATIVDTGGENCDQRGVEWGLSSGNYYASSVGSGSFGTGSFTKLMQGLSAGITYYYRAKAHNTVGWGYGNEVSFVTLTADANKIAYDIGSGTENLSDRTIIRAETGEGTESYKRKIIAEISILIASYSKDDTGSGLDALLDRYTGGIDAFGTDTGSGIDSYKRSKLGEVSRLLAIYSRDDAGSGAGTSVERHTAKFGTDNGGGTDALISLLAIISASDTGRGTDTFIYIPIPLIAKSRSLALTVYSRSLGLKAKTRTVNLTARSRSIALKAKSRSLNLTARKRM